MKRHGKKFTMMRMLLVVSVLLAGMCQSVAAAATTSQIVLTLFRSEEHRDAVWTKLVFTEVFQRLGMEFVYKGYPQKRGIAMVEAGEVDGLLGQPQEFEAYHPNLIRVTEPYNILKYSAFAIDPAIQVDGWESLRGTGYRIDYLRGTDVGRQFLLDVVTPEQLSEVNDWRAGLKKLIAGRTDLFLYVEVSMMHELRAGEFKDAGVRNAGVLMEVPVYIYLHNTHADLAPKLAEALKAVKAEGLIEKYRVMAYEE